MPTASFVASIPGRNSTAKHELIFLAKNVSPLGSQSYYIEASVSKEWNDPSISIPFWNSSDSSNIMADFQISNKVISL